MRTILIGAGGLLGSAFAEQLVRRGMPYERVRPAWGDPAAVEVAVRDALRRSVRADAPTLVVWAAGVGHVGASPEAMRSETAAVWALCAAVRALPAPAPSLLSIIFASSAGALFGGHGAAEVGDETLPAPITPYGREKLVQEQALCHLADDVGCRVLACRYSNLYGLAGGRLPRRGLISVAVRASRLRQPMIVYVSPDTRRDLVYNVDAAAASLHAVGAVGDGFSVALVRDGGTRTIADVLALIGHVGRRKVPVTYADRPESRVQPRVLRFTQPARGPGDVSRTPMATAVHRMLRAPMSP